MKVEPSTWLQRFVLPLVAGGDVRVAGAIGAEQLALMQVASFDGDALLRVAEARHAVMAELLIDAHSPELDDESLRLAVAMQDLLFLVHPAATGALVRKSRLGEVARFAAHLTELEPPSGAWQLAARHSILHHLFDLGRDDVRVSFWAGKREFKGSEPPARLLKWASLRRVREERWRVSIVTEAVADPRLRAIVVGMLEASPLTNLLDPLRLDPPLELRHQARWLREPAVARAVADRWLALGLPLVGPALVAALLRLYDLKDEADEARVATSFACHLHLLALVGGPPRSFADHLTEIQAQVHAQAALKDFYGVFAAAQRVGIGRPADVVLDRRVEEAVNAYSMACGAVCGEPRVLELASLMMRSVRAQLAVSASG